MPILIIFIIIIFVALILDREHQKKKVPKGMKKCPYCKNLIDEKATVCHHCLRNIGSESLLSVLLAFVLLIGFIAFFLFTFY